MPHRDAKILLAEDEPTNMVILSAYLRRAGYDVVEAEDGVEAWSQLQQNPDFDAIVTDRLMPKMDGLELFARVQKSEHLHNIPVIMQTGAKSPEEMAEGIKAGVYYYLTKPYQEEVLLSLVGSAVRARRQSSVFEERAERQQTALSQTFVEGRFRARTISDIQNLALLLGNLFDRAELAATGLFELLLNAVEHGNLEIGFDLKAELLANGGWEAEILRRLALPENSQKDIDVTVRRDGRMIEIEIADKGKGFDWRPFMLVEPSRATRGNGRGIAKANLVAFDKLTYRAPGNVVTVRGEAVGS